MLQVKITPDVIARAKRKAASVGVLQGSVTGSLSHVVGAIGEVVVADALDASEANTYDYDLLKNGNRIDVKTKRCRSKPFPHYECTVTAHGSKQDCDTYIFVRILNDNTTAWILGGISKEEFYEKATRYKRGDVDPSNDFTFKADSYNLPISELHDVQQSMSV